MFGIPWWAWLLGGGAVLYFMSKSSATAQAAAAAGVPEPSETDKLALALAIGARYGIMSPVPLEFEFVTTATPPYWRVNYGPIYEAWDAAAQKAIYSLTPTPSPPFSSGNWRGGGGSYEKLVKEFLP